MNQKSGTYQYKKITTTTTTRIVSNNPINKTNAGESQKGKIDMNILKNENVEFYKCNKCGKFKYRIGAKKITHETGSFTRKTELTEIEKRSLEKYAKYNMASKTACPVCGNPRTKCVCKKNRSTSVSTVLNKRSAQGGPVDLTPKFKIDLNPEKIRKALEEQKRLAEEQRRKKESKTHKVEENVRRVIKEEKYTYDKKKERNIKEEDLCHCGDENCEVNIEIRKKKEMEEMMKKRREEELRRAELMEKQRLKKIEEERIKKMKMEEEERRRREEEERRRREEEERLRREAERKRKEEEERRRRKMEEEQRLRLEKERKEKEMAEAKRRLLEQMQFKDVPVKTFYMEYIQKRYKNADMPFPERNTYTINITQDMAQTNSNINMNINQNLLIQNRNIQSGNCICPGCGRMTYSQMSNVVQSSENNTNIEQIENNVVVQNQQKVIKNNVSGKKEECLCHECNNEVAEEKKECICPDCNKVEEKKECICPDCNKVEEKKECICTDCNIVEEKKEEKQECLCPECKNEEVVQTA